MAQAAPMLWCILQLPLKSYFARFGRPVIRRVGGRHSNRVSGYKGAA